MRGRHPKAPSAAPISRRKSLHRPKLLPPLAAVFSVSLILGVSLATATAPTVTIEAATGVGYVTATAKGTVDPGDHETSYRFRYATQAQFEASEFTEAASSTELSLPEGAGPTPVQAILSGLAPNTTYHLRLEASNPDGTRQAVAPETFTTKEVARPSVSIDAPSSITTSSAQLSGQVNPNGTDPAFDTHWELECVPRSRCFDFDPQRRGDIPADKSNHPIAAEVRDLEPGTEYTLTLSATNAGGTETAQTAFTTQAAAPSINALAHTSGVSQTGATLHAKVDPNGAETSYRFEWGTDASYGNVVPVPEEAIGAGSEPVEVSAPLSGLSPDTAYHYRVVAISSLGTVEGPDHEFRTWPVPKEIKPSKYPGQGFLPDNRAWEMVSPPDKNGGQVTASPGAIRVSSNGDAAIFDSTTPFGDAVATGSIGSVTYKASRGGEEWLARSLFPRQDPSSIAAIFGPLLSWFTPDLSYGALHAGNPQLTNEAPADITNLYLVSTGGGAPTLLTPSEAQVDPSRLDTFSPGFIDASSALNRIAVASTQDLTTETSDGSPKLYLWENGTLRLAGVLPDGTPALGAEAGPSESLLFGGLDTDQALSDDGDRLYFTTSNGELLLRKDNESTVAVSESEASPTAPPARALFWKASADGRRAFFTTDAQLLDSDLNSEGQDLYMYTDSPNPALDSNLTLVSEDRQLDDGVSPEVEGVLGVSADGGRVYFGARGALTEGQPETTGIKIYLWDDGNLRYVATVDSRSRLDQANWLQYGSARLSRVSGTGRYLLFSTSAAQASGYDNAGHVEIYRYDALTEEAVCVSCRRDGASATADALLLYETESLTATYRTYESRLFASDGKRVFFNTAESLIPEQDNNGKVDAYEWEEGGVGSCRKPEGCLFLLSNGHGASNSYVADASLSGNAAYLLTRDQLSRWDVDQGRDLYVARIDGGLPEPQQVPPACQGDACQPLTLSPENPTPASAGFSGAGNRRPGPSRRGRCGRRHHKVRVKSKRSFCVKKRERHSKISTKPVGGYSYE